MIRFLVVLALCYSAEAQKLLPAELGRASIKQSGFLPLQCEVRPIQPNLNFSFRFHAGYSVEVPLSQYRGGDHHWQIVLRVQPESGGDPVYLEDRLNLPNVPDTGTDRQYGQFSGSFLAGEGFYRISFLLLDDQRRGCRSEWGITVATDQRNRRALLLIAPGTVVPVSDLSSQDGNHSNGAPFEKLTVLLDAASGSPSGPTVSPLQLSWLPPLLQLARTRSIRLIAFNMDLQRVIYREERFTLDHLSELRQAMFSMQLGVASVDLLQNPKGHIGLLTDLVKQEIHSPEPSSMVVFLGTIAWQKDRPSPDAVERPAAGAPAFFYLEYRHPVSMRIAAQQGASSMGLPDAAGATAQGARRAQSPGILASVPTDVRTGPEPDTVERLMPMLRGKTLIVQTPAEFAKAIRTIASSKH